MRVLTIVFALALGVSGCAQIQSLFAGGSVGDASPQTLADAEKVLAITHYAYDGAGNILKNLAETGALKGDAAAEMQALYDKAGDILAAADKADEAADAKGVTDFIAQVDDLLGQINALIPAQH